MKIVRVSQLSGKKHIQEIDVTPEQLNRFEHRYQTGEHILSIFPKLSADDREFIKTGITKEEWDSMELDEDVPFPPMKAFSALPL